MLIPVSWNNTKISLIHPTKIEPVNESPYSDRRLSEDNSSPDAADDNDAESNSMQIMNSYDVDMSPSYEQEHVNPPIVYNSHLHVHMR